VVAWLRHFVSSIPLYKGRGGHGLDFSKSNPDPIKWIGLKIHIQFN